VFRLAFVSHSLPRDDRPDENVGGMQRVARELHDALERSGDVRLHPVVMRATWAETHRRVGPFLASSLMRLRRMFGSGDIDAVLYSSMITAALDPLLRRLRQRQGVGAGVIVHGLDVTTPTRLWQWYVRRVFRSVDRVFPVSRATADACMKRGLELSRVYVVPNGVDVARFGGERETAGARDRLATIPGLSNLPPDAFVLASVGRHVERKGFAWFAGNVMQLLGETVHYVIAGEGPESARIGEAASAAGVAGRVHLPGRLSESDLLRLYAGADVFVMPNVRVRGDMEGFGVVLLEAALSGTPAVAAAIDGILDVITPGENGVLVESGDAAAFAGAIRRYNEDRALLGEASRRARSHTTANFGWDAIARRYVTVLADVATVARPGPGR